MNICSRQIIAVITITVTIAIIYAVSIIRKQRNNFGNNYLHLELDKNGKNTNSNFLDGCYHVYLDVGSNIGIQVRKLYEPEFYPDANVSSVFDELFGNRSQRYLNQVCSVGFEPNPNHELKLKEIEAAYSQCNWPVTFMTRTAVGDYEGTATFYTDEDTSNMEWGGSIVENNKSAKRKSVDVKVVSLSDFINNIVAKRKLPRSKGLHIPPAVLMKMDIEGSEIETIPDLIITGSFQHLTKSMVEFHDRLIVTEERRQLSVEIIKALNMLQNITGRSFFIHMDDETYGKTNYPLPTCTEKL